MTKGEGNIDQEIEEVNSSIKSILPPTPVSQGKKSKLPEYTFYTLLAAVVLFMALYFGPQIIGMVTFTESVITTEDVGLEVEKNSRIALEPTAENIDALMLSGTVYGSGRATVFLETSQGRELVYYFEGDAGEGQTFTNMCFDTCHIKGLPDDAILSVRLDNTRLQIDKATYMSSKLVDMTLLPKNTVIDYKKERAKTVELTLTNTQKADYSMILLIDGPLTDSFSWEGSLIKMRANETEKKIPITIKLPSNLQPGTYEHKITARYVPPDGQQFTGTAPVDEAYITITNQQ
jgi:hypothetical protein